jgi:hypothetical protein
MHKAIVKASGSSGLGDFTVGMYHQELFVPPQYLHYYSQLSIKYQE